MRVGTLLCPWFWVPEFWVRVLFWPLPRVLFGRPLKAAISAVTWAAKESKSGKLVAGAGAAGAGMAGRCGAMAAIGAGLSPFSWYALK